MSEIKVGDKVRVLFTTKEMHSQNYYKGVYSKGDEAVVKSIVSSVKDVYIVKLEGDAHHCSKMLSSQVELVEDTSKRRPHYDLIIAWANGSEIQYEARPDGWITNPTPAFSPKHNYRIKPAAKAEEISSIRKEMDKLASRLKELEK